MIKITVTNNICELGGLLKEQNKLFEAFKVRIPGAFYLRKYMPRGWDGKKCYITEAHRFKTGLLPDILRKCEELKIEYTLIDNRPLKLIRKPEFTRDLCPPYEMRGKYKYQGDAVKALIKNKVGGLKFQRGGIKVATNGGKTVISSGIYMAYQEPTIFLMNSKELFEQALKDIPKIIDERVGIIGKGKVIWAKFMICMVGTMKSRMPSIKQKLQEYKVLIVDEGDLVDNKTNKTVIQNLYNTMVRVQLSGTLNASPLKKGLIHNMNVKEFFGDIIFEVTNRELIDLGISSEVEVKFLEGNIDPMIGYGYPDQVEHGIIVNKDRNRKIIQRSLYHALEGRRNQLIIAQRHRHIKRIYNRLVKAHIGLNIDWVHHSRKDRFQVVDKFEKGEIDILVGSMILKRGKNFPLMNYMLVAGGGKSPANILQLLGRAFRGCKHMEDFWDEGKNLKQHSRRRALFYKKEKIKVINNFK